MNNPFHLVCMFNQQVQHIEVGTDNERFKKKILFFFFLKTQPKLFEKCKIIMSVSCLNNNYLELKYYLSFLQISDVAVLGLPNQSMDSLCMIM